MERFDKIVKGSLKTPFYICSFLLFVFLLSRLTKSNWEEVDYTFVKADSVGGNDGAIPAICKLNELVEGNFLDRSYYEASAFETTSWGRLFANYNKKYQALFIGTGDGWSYFFYATPEQLKMIADRRIPANKLHLFLKPFPQKHLGEIPTRSRDLFSVF